MKNIVIISSSMRKGNSDILCDEFEKGAKNAGNNITRINIREYNIKFCSACSDCYNVGRCIHKDDMNNFYEAIKNSDILVFATPIYFGSISGSLKVFIDRLYPIYQSLKASEVYVIATCYSNEKKFIDESLHSIRRFLEDAGNIPIRQIIYGENTDEAGDVSSEQKRCAYNAGCQVF